MFVGGLGIPELIGLTLVAGVSITVIVAWFSFQPKAGRNDHTLSSEPWCKTQMYPRPRGKTQTYPRCWTGLH